MQERFNAKIVKNDGRFKVDWNQSFSPHDYMLSEVISAVVKEMRRGNEEEAAFWAYQMMISGNESEEFLWERYKIFTMEDIGLANTQALSFVNNTEKKENLIDSLSAFVLLRI